MKDKTAFICEYSSDLVFVDTERLGILADLAGTRNHDTKTSWKAVLALNPRIERSRDHVPKPASLHKQISDILKHLRSNKLLLERRPSSMQEVKHFICGPGISHTDSGYGTSCSTASDFVKISRTTCVVLARRRTAEMTGSAPCARSSRGWSHRTQRCRGPPHPYLPFVVDGRLAPSSKCSLGHVAHLSSVVLRLWTAQSDIY